MTMSPTFIWYLLIARLRYKRLPNGQMVRGWTAMSDQRRILLIKDALSPWRGSRVSNVGPCHRVFCLNSFQNMQSSARGKRRGFWLLCLIVTTCVRVGSTKLGHRRNCMVRCRLEINVIDKSNACNGRKYAHEWFDSKWLESRSFNAEPTWEVDVGLVLLVAGDRLFGFNTFIAPYTSNIIPSDVQKTWAVNVCSRTLTSFDLLQ